MNDLKRIAQHHNKLALFLAGVLLILSSSCASKSPFLTSEVIPAARGYVKVKKDDSGNYQIQLDLDYLAESGRLNPPRKTYVIWMESQQNSTRNIGQINSSSAFLSSKLKANFETSSSFEPTRIFITAEDDGMATYPGAQLVLTTGVLKG